MNLLRNRILSILGLSFALGSSAAILSACDDGGNGPGIGDNLAEQCGLVCPDKTLIEGNASISGVLEIDAFFSGVLSLRDAASSTKLALELELRGLAADLGLTIDANASIDQVATQIQTELKAKIAANVQGSLTVKFDPPKCEADIQVVAKASAECEGKVDPGSVEVKCSGSCEIEATAQAKCMETGTLKCDVQMPGATCMGSCSGSCELTAAAMCEGECEGTCTGSCSACLGGTCEMDGSGAITNCVGSCSGMCTGSCELRAGGSCTGKCEGRCEYTPPSGSCEANATVKCEAKAEATIDCKGKCEGEVTPPSAKVECQAAVEAKAKAEVVCTPPQLSVDFQWAAGATVEAQAEFRALMNSFRVRYSAMLALNAKLEGIAKAAVKLSSTGVSAIEGSVEAAKNAAGSGNLKLAVGLGCALPEVKVAGTILVDVGAQVTATVTAFGKVTESVNPAYTR